MENFDILSEAPNGIKMLRELILQLAVMGKLVSQDAGDDPADVLLEQVNREKEKLIKEGKLKKQDPLPEITDAEKPYALPKNWKWIRLGDALELINGKAFKPTDWSFSGLPIIRIQNLNDESAAYNYCDYKIDEKFHVSDGDFLISWSGTPGTSFGAFIWQRGHAVLNQHIFKCILIGDAFKDKYLRFAVNSRLDEMIAQARGGVGLRHITKSKLENLCISLPPLAEQKRIVAQVDRLMSLCDELEKKKEKRERKRVSLNNALLEKLLSSREADEFNEHWKRITENFDILYNTPDNVVKLKQSILQLAVMGKLVPRDPDDEPAVVLLDRIKKEKDRLIKEGKLKHHVPLPGIAEGEKAYELLEGWEWCQLDDITIFGPQNGLSPKPVENETDVKSLTLTATTSGHFKPQHFKYVSDSINIPPTCWLEKDDLLIQRGNSIEYVGIAAIYDGPSHEFIHPDLMMKIRVSNVVNVKYIHLCLIAGNSRQYFMSKASGTSGSMPKVNQSIVRAVPIPLAPFSTQRRIVAKVERLMGFCDDLEKKLRDGERKRDTLFNAVVNQLST